MIIDFKDWNPKGKKVLLYSGGMDSWLIDKLWKPDLKLFIRIHTKNNELEYNKLMDLIEKGEIEGDIAIYDMDLSPFERADQNYFLPLRNLHFATIAGHFGETVCLGATGSSTHYDKTNKFGMDTSNLISYLLSEQKEGPFKVVLPFRTTTKTQLLKRYLDEGGDIEKAYKETVSCYTPKNGKGCMSCTSCMSKFVAFYNNGYNFTKKDIQRFLDYVEKTYTEQKPDVVKLYDSIKSNSN